MSKCSHFDDNSNIVALTHFNIITLDKKKNLCLCRGSNKKQKTNYKPTMKTQICGNQFSY